MRFSKKTNLGIERCEPRLALDASQGSEGELPGSLPVVQPAALLSTAEIYSHGNRGPIAVPVRDSLFPDSNLSMRHPLGRSDFSSLDSVDNESQINSSLTGDSATRVFTDGMSPSIVLQVELMEISSVREKQPDSFKEAPSPTTSLSQHRQADPAILHVSSLQTVPFDSARLVFRADQAFTVLASNDRTQLVKSQSETLRGEPSYAGFLDVQATVAEIDSAQKTQVDALVFDHENGSPLFEENGLHGNTNLMPVMARATLFEVAEHRVPSLPRAVVGGHDAQKNSTNREKAVASTTLPQDILLASGDSADWATRDLSLYVRLSLAAAFATTTFQIEKRTRSTNVSGIKADDTSAKQKRVLR